MAQIDIVYCSQTD